MELVRKGRRRGGGERIYADPFLSGCDKKRAGGHDVTSGQSVSEHVLLFTVCMREREQVKTRE